MRDHRRLEAFRLADALALDVYRHTGEFPKAEQYGLTQQIRRSAVSVPSNIVEGCARNSEGDFLRFLDIAFGSLRELEYQLSLAWRLEFLKEQLWSELRPKCTETSRVLGALMNGLRPVRASPKT